jgi:hypothetical protein
MNDDDVIVIGVVDVVVVVVVVMEFVVVGVAVGVFKFGIKFGELLLQQKVKNFSRSRSKQTNRKSMLLK